MGACAFDLLVAVMSVGIGYILGSGWRFGATDEPEPEPVDDEGPRIPIGTVVKLRSGGPIMTVCWLVEGGDLRCVWDDEGAAAFEDYPADALMVVQ